MYHLSKNLDGFLVEVAIKMSTGVFVDIVS